MENVSIIRENDYTKTDGTYSALIKVYGYEFSVSGYTDTKEVKVFGTQSGAYDRRPKWQKKSASKIAAEFTASKIN